MAPAKSSPVVESPAPEIRPQAESAPAPKPKAVAEKPDLSPQVDDKPMPFKAATGGQKLQASGTNTGAPVVNFAEAKRLKIKREGIVATGGRNRGRKTVHSVKVDAVKASKGTWAFRIRERVDGVRGTPITVSRVTDEVYEMIKEGNYEKFKEQLIRNHAASALRSSNRA